MTARLHTRRSSQRVAAPSAAPQAPQRGRRPGVAVIIAAGGRGRRMGGRTPKQFLPLAGVPVIARTIGAFDRVPAVREIVVVVPAGALRRTAALVRRGGFGIVARVVPGGKERQDSVFRGIEACTRRKGIVLVHDAVRPFVSRALIDGVIRAAARYGAAVPALPVTDTIKTHTGGPRGFFSATLPRGELWAVQTPQGFRFGLLRDAHVKAARAGFAGTDDASLVERLGVRVRIVPGSDMNIKITTPRDRKLAESLI
ncbi:MAG TPA: 2-C-methyl-D-erythritol 4-phosphate cytidylyltransferase, partial [Bacteroidota bacterium]|nr:2-C-methyl-D-erythritol 4-phosphate cytidylyltransferase [Bacteroidota bacterium]